MTSIKTAIITGSSSGVGAATAKLFAEKGWNVTVNYSRSQQAAEQVVASCNKTPGSAIAVQADVAEDQDCQKLVAATVEAFGGVDVLINNAGTTKFCDHSDLDGLDVDDFLNIYRVNVVGPFQMVRACLPYLQKSENPSVIMTSSHAGVTAQGSSVAYCASKAALNNMTMSLARALGPIPVNSICPGFIEGEWLRKGLGDEAYERIRESVIASSPLGRAATAESIAEIMLVFAEQAKLFSGETLLLNGGAHLGPPPFGRK